MTKLITIPKFARPPVCRTGSVLHLLGRARFRLSPSDFADGSMCAGWSMVGDRRLSLFGTESPTQHRELGAFSTLVNQGVQAART